jgi:hypothetical protein
LLLLCENRCKKLRQAKDFGFTQVSGEQVTQAQEIVMWFVRFYLSMIVLAQIAQEIRNQPLIVEVPFECARMFYLEADDVFELDMVRSVQSLGFTGNQVHVGPCSAVVWHLELKIISGYFLRR